MSEFKCCLCGQIVDDDVIEVHHYGDRFACDQCINELLIDD